MANESTIILISLASGISLILGLYMLFLYKSTQARGTAYWAAGSLTIGIGVALMSIPQDNNYTFIKISFLLVAIGLYTYLAGIWDFKEKPINKWIVFGLPTIDLVQFAIHYNVENSYRTEVAIHSAIIAVYCVIALYEMLRLDDNQKYLKKIFRINAISYLIYLLIMLGRIASLTFNPNFVPFQMTNIQIAMFILIDFLMLALTLGLLSAVYVQVHNSLKDQLKARSKFFAIIAHDLRNPIGTIMNFLELLNNEPDLDEEERKNCLKETEALSRSTTHLLQNLFEWATSSIHLTKAQDEVIDLSKLISSNLVYFKSLTKLKSIHIELNLEDNSLMNGSIKMIDTILRNLVSNAAKYTPEGGKVLLSTEKNTKNVRLIVSDTGIGIEPERLSTLFSFEMSKSTVGTSGESGSGFGLALSNEFVKQNNGTLQIESKPNDGTKVIVEFPVAT